MAYNFPFTTTDCHFTSNYIFNSGTIAACMYLITKSYFIVIGQGMFTVLSMRKNIFNNFVIYIINS